MREYDCKALGLQSSATEQTIAKPLYGLTPVPRVRIPPSPPLPLSSSYATVIPTLIPESGRVTDEPGSQCHEPNPNRSEEHTSELQSLRHLVCRLLLEK